MMRKLMVAVAVGSLFSVLMSSAQASEAIFKKSGCVGCHMVDKKMVGPALKDIAAKYKGQGDAVAKLSEKLRKGGTGVWGTIPMPPNDPTKINDADLKAVVEWVLTQ